MFRHGEKAAETRVSRVQSHDNRCSSLALVAATFAAAAAAAACSSILVDAVGNIASCRENPVW